MKKVTVIMFMLAMLMVSCADDEKWETVSTETVVDMAQYDEALFSNREIISNWAYAVVDAQEEKNQSC